ncbi:MAG: class I SAM-dependent methyltransferase [Flavisolibacter sp.]
MDSTIFCKVCDEPINKSEYALREMHLGLREEFIYYNCLNCGIMQIGNIPHNLEKYYPTDHYYSFKSKTKPQIKVDLLRKTKAEYILYRKQPILGWLLSIGYKKAEYFNWLKEAGATFEDFILDVGSGNGGLLLNLAKLGFKNLYGIDPYNNIDHDYGSFTIERKDIFQTDGSFDLIMMHHSFEHMDEPKKVFQRLYNLLKPGKCLLIRTPVMGNYLWNCYKENWMSLDAPRHLIIHTEKSIRILANLSGLELKKIMYDSSEVNLIISEQYKMNIPLNDNRSYAINKKSNLFTRYEINHLVKFVGFRF